MKNPDAYYIDVVDKDGNVIGYEASTPPDAVMPNIMILHNQRFRDLLTLDEKVAIKQSADPMVQVLQDEMITGVNINLESQETIDLITNLVTVGIMTAERKDEILAGVPYV